MTEFREQDLTAARFDGVNLRGATFTKVHLNDATMHGVDFTGTRMRGIEGEWSFIQTLRHLNFASAAWVCRMVLGQASPWHKLDLPWYEAPGWDGIPWYREARPSFDEVLTVRSQRQVMVHNVMESLTDEQLASTVTRTEPGWPQIEDFPLKDCLQIVVNEEWEHRLYAERDLTALEIGN